MEDKSSGGIYLPDSAKERESYATDRGEILAVGEGFFDTLPGPKPAVGDKVIFNKYAGSVLYCQNGSGREMLRLVNDKDICAILKEESNG